MSRAASLASLAAALVLVHLALVLPNHPDAMRPGALRVFMLELPAIVLLLAAASGRWLRPLRIAVTVFLAGIVILKLAHYGANVAFLRDVNLVLDRHLVPAGWRMLSGAIGLVSALALAAAALALLAAGVAGLWWASGRLGRLRLPGPPAAWALGAVALVAADRLAPPALDPPGVAFNTRLAIDHAREARRALADLETFRAEAAQDPFDGAGAGLLSGLRGQDVLVIFAESYGRSALDNPRYGPTISARLAAIEADLAASGLEARSAFLTSPVAGGQSWLAHATLLTGLWIDNQGRYDALIASPRRTLLHLARDAGWRTAAVMPAITLDWPDARYFGYDTILNAAALDYAGPPFNWVTMPDQFTLASFERKLLAPADRAPVFAEIALISSHAPWTPVAELVPWEAVGDGRVFAQFLDNGDPPATIWRDMERVRAQYPKALDYTLAAAGAFAARAPGRDPLIVLVGDHQPASPVSEDPETREVPIHVIGAPDTLSALDGWGWTPGMLPATDAPVWRMDAFRDRFLGAFSGPSATGPGDAALLLR